MRNGFIGIIAACWLAAIGCSAPETSSPGLSFADTGSTDSVDGTTDGDDVGDTDGSVDANSSDDQLDAADETDSTTDSDGDDITDGTDTTSNTDATDETDSSDGTDAVDETDGNDACGNGTCDEDETDESCPIDCTGSGAAGCLKEKCGSELTACIEFSTCASIYECLLGCTDQACSQACFVNGDPDGALLMSAALQCGQIQGCFGEPECGDGICAEGETNQSCPEDCAEASCFQTSCPDELATCLDNEGCTSLYECWTECENSTCQSACFTTATPAAIALMQDLVTCGEAAGCGTTIEPTCGDGTCDPSETAESCPEDCITEPTCGDGTCDAQETPEDCPADCAPPEDSCSGKCIADYQQGLPCQCDELCLAYGDCCMDFVSLCAEGDAFLCILDKCDVSGDCAGDNGCNAGIKCVAECSEGQSCVDDCVEETPNNAKDAVSGYGGCAIAQECIPSAMMGPICGNAECEAGETPESCAQDCLCGDGICADDESVESCPADCTCGNGDCDENESPESCPADCALPTEASCSGKCLSEYVNNAPCQCDEFCLGFGDCCSDFEALCYDVSIPILCILNECNVGGQCANDNGCATGIECLADCDGDNSEQCVTACVDAAPNNDKDEVTDFGACAISEGCIGSTMDSCGNGICDDGETSASCSEDCKCGNGTCDDGESFIKCPADCSCGNNVCEQSETPKSCPTDCSNISFDLCVTQYCPTQLGQCTTDFGCLMVLSCINGCDSESSCVSECFLDGSAPFDDLKACASSVGCLE